MKDIELNKYKKIVYIIGWIFTCLNIFLILITFGICLFKDRGHKKVKGKLTRSFEKFIYVVGYIYSVIIPIGITYGFIVGMFFDDSLDYSNDIDLNYSWQDYLDYPVELECESVCLELGSNKYQLSKENNKTFNCNCYDSEGLLASYILYSDSEEEISEQGKAILNEYYSTEMSKKEKAQTTINYLNILREEKNLKPIQWNEDIYTFSRKEISFIYSRNYVDDYDEATGTEIYEVDFHRFFDPLGIQLRNVKWLIYSDPDPLQSLNYWIIDSEQDYLWRNESNYSGAIACSKDSCMFLGYWIKE